MRIATTSARCATDPAFKLACGHLPETGADLASQPTLSRLENAPTIRDAIRLTYALIDQWMESYATAPDGVVLDIDDTCDVVHGHQQLSLFNAHYDERCFLPIHVYDSATGRPVAIVLRPGKTPSGVEVRAHLRRLVRRIRTRWPLTHITIRGDSHYARPEAMDFCEQNGISYIFGLAGTRPLTTKVQDVADAVRTQRAVEDREVVRGFAETTHRARSWSCERRVMARIEATRLGLDIRFVVTNLTGTSPRVIYESLYCARGQAENWIKFHKAQLASDRTSCRRAVANQVRLVLHTAAYWLMLAVREAIPAARDLARAEFVTLRLRLLKIAVRVQETTSRVRLGLCLLLPGRRPLPPPCERSGTPATGGLALSDGAAVALINPCPSLPTRSPRSRPRRAERDATDWHARAANQVIATNSGEYDRLEAEDAPSSRPRRRCRKTFR